jgi:hypothetical protein
VTEALPDGDREKMLVGEDLNEADNSDKDDNVHVSALWYILVAMR